MQLRLIVTWLKRCFPNSWICNKLHLAVRVKVFFSESDATHSIASCAYSPKIYWVVQVLLAEKYFNWMLMNNQIFTYCQGIMQKKYGCIDFWQSQSDCSWGSEGPRGSRVMPWWRCGCKVPEQFCFCLYKTC